MTQRRCAVRRRLNSVRSSSDRCLIAARLPQVRLTRFANDWSRALEMGLVRMILRNDDEGDDWVDKDGDGIPDEVEEVGEAIWLHNQLLYATFSHYASLNGSLDAITLNSWNAFVHDCGLPLKGRRYRKESDFDLIFLEADACGKIVSRGGTIALFRNSDTHNRGARGHRAAAPAAQGNVREFGHNASMLDDPSPADLDWRASAHVTAQLQPQVLPRQQRLVMEKEHQLSRSEFLIALVRIAINIFVLPNIVPDVSDAMDRLLGVVVQVRSGHIPVRDAPPGGACQTLASLPLSLCFPVDLSSDHSGAPARGPRGTLCARVPFSRALAPSSLLSPTPSGEPIATPSLRARCSSATRSGSIAASAAW